MAHYTHSKVPKGYSIIMIIFLGMEECIVRNDNNNKEMVKSRSQSTSLAEEAVDQLQASEKLIAGKLCYNDKVRTIILLIF